MTMYMTAFVNGNFLEMQAPKEWEEFTKLDWKIQEKDDRVTIMYADNDGEYDISVWEGSNMPYGKVVCVEWETLLLESIYIPEPKDILLFFSMHVVPFMQFNETARLAKQTKRLANATIAFGRHSHGEDIFEDDEE
jgi:hypothetical protein